MSVLSDFYALYHFVCHRNLVVSEKSLVFRKFGLRKYVLVSTKFVSEKDLGFGIGKFGLRIKMSWLQ